MFRLLQQNRLEEVSSSGFIITIILCIPYVVTIFSALRLAKFNLDTRQSDSFIGLPTPANTLFIISLPLIIAEDEFGLTSFILNPYFLIGICILQSWLLVSELPLMAFKFKKLSWKENNYQFMIIVAAIILLPLLKFVTIPVIIFLYILLSQVKMRNNKIIIIVPPR